MMAELIASDSKRIVVGLGQTGLSCARYLARRGQPFQVADSRLDPPGLSEFREQFPEVPLHLGKLDSELLSAAGELILSPGLAPDEPALKAAREAGAAVIGDIELFCREAKAPIVAITGSNGKSTVTTLVGNMARRAGRQAQVGGNIGVPALDLLELDAELYVLELSSFQLELVESVNAEVATVLNLSPDHLDRYPSMLDYHMAKHRIFRGCRQIVVNRGDPLSQPLLPATIKRWTFGLDLPDFGGFGLRRDGGETVLMFEQQDLMPRSALKLPGQHNVENALAALALGKAIDLPLDVMVEELKTFGGLPHRCQWVAERDGVLFYNDSKGTNVGATSAALRGLAAEGRRVVLIAGGVGKGQDFAPLKSVLGDCGRGAVLIGEAAPELEQLFRDALPVQRASSMPEAVNAAAALAAPGDAVLLSPACASFDQFSDYRARGEAFCAAVQALVEGAS